MNNETLSNDWDIITPNKSRLSNIEKKIEEIEKSNNIIIEMLKENRELYLKALNEVNKKEEENLEEIRELKPIIINQNKPSLLDCIGDNNLESNVGYIDRLSNRVWRNNYLTTPNISLSNFNKK